MKKFHGIRFASGLACAVWMTCGSMPGQAVTITCPGDAVVECGDSTAPEHTGWAVSADGQGMPVPATYVDSIAQGECPVKQVITRVWQAESAGGAVGVAAWGNNLNGQSAVPPGLDDVIAVSAGALHSLALRSDGTVVAWGANTTGQSAVPPGLAGVAAISAGQLLSLALKVDGTVAAWGTPFYGLNTVPAGLGGVIAVSAGYWNSLALKNDGTVVAWGSNSSGQSALPAGLTGVTAVSAGGSHCLALKNDGTVVAWGSNANGQRTVPPGLADVIGISAGGFHSLALKSDGAVVAWGSNAYGQSAVPPGLDGVVAISAGYNHSLALTADGTVVAWGSNAYGESTAPAGAALSIDAGGNHNLALMQSGGVETATCVQTILVVDTTPPAILSDARDITPPEAPIAFTFAAVDGCSEASDVQLSATCHKVAPNGRIVNPGNGCGVEIHGDQVWITRSCGVGAVIAIRAIATDACGNTADETFVVNVLNPGKGARGRGAR